MPRSQIDELQAEETFMTESEHTALGNGSPHHARGHSFHNNEDHTNINDDPEIGDVPVLRSGGWEFEPKSSANIFGTEYYYTESEALSSTTSTTYQQKVRLSVTDLPAGTYRIGWSYEWRGDSQRVAVKTRVQLDDTTDLSRVEPSPNRNNETHPASGFKDNLSLSGNHTIDIDWATAQNGKTAYIGRARLELWRVS